MIQYSLSLLGIEYTQLACGYHAADRPLCSAWVFPSQMQRSSSTAFEFRLSIHSPNAPSLPRTPITNNDGHIYKNASIRLVLSLR